MAPPVMDPAAIAAEIAHVRSLAPDALRRRWRAEFGRKPPGSLSRDLLRRMIAMRIQEQAFGGLDRESLMFLDGLARRGVSPRRHMPATVPYDRSLRPDGMRQPRLMLFRVETALEQ